MAEGPPELGSELLALEISASVRHARRLVSAGQMAWLHGSVGQSLISLTQAPEGVAGISELFFFLRFFWPEESMLPEHSSFFADPHAPDLTASEEGTVQLLLEIQPSDQTPVRSDFAAWRLLLDSKLANMTACGHLADTLLNKIYFSSLQERGGNLVPLQKTEEEMPVIPPQLQDGRLRTYRGPYRSLQLPCVSPGASWTRGKPCLSH